MESELEDQFEAIQYVGRPGISADCLDGIMRFIQFGDIINSAWLLTANAKHCFLLQINERQWVGVKSGFGSGYGGEGPKALSSALQILKLHGAIIDEYEVKRALLDRLDRTKLTCDDFSALQSMQPMRPERWHDYILGTASATSTTDGAWQHMPPVIPYSIIDNRIADLAVEFFKQPDETLVKGFRRLEETIRTRTKAEGFGSRLLKSAFEPPNGYLTWDGINEEEQKSRAKLFIGAFGACRNPRTHRSIQETLPDQLSEFMLLNTLFRLERESIKRT